MRRVSPRPIPAPPPLVPGGAVARVRRNPAQFGVVEFTNGHEGPAVCLHCPDAPCVVFSPDEVQVEVGIETTYSSNRGTCVYDAISWDDESASPLINPDVCTGCGVCIGRCPVGAIRLNDGIAELNSGKSAHFGPAIDSIQFERARGELKEAGVRECVKGAPGALVNQMPDIIRGLLGSGDTRLAFGLLVRNLFLTAGLASRTSITGDNNALGDIVVRLGNRTAVTELDLGAGMLDAVRRVLTDLAIAHSRRGKSRTKLVAVVVCADFPRRRSDVYELLGDIRAVLDLDIRVLPLALLVLLAAYGVDVDSRGLLRGFLLDRGEEDTLDDVRAVLGPCAPTRSSRFFGPEK